jgi:uncharacterized protein (DUF305 family)
MKKVQAFAATIMLAAVTFAFTTKPVSTNTDNPMLKIVEETFHTAMSIVPTHDRNHDFLHYIEALHKGGMELAKMEIAKGTDAEIKELAEAAVEAMKTDMTLIAQYYKENQQKGDTKEKFFSEVQKALDEMNKKADNSHLNGNVDHDYTMMMQRVADAEREVAKAYIRLGSDPKLEQLAQRLAADNKEEKKDLKEEHKTVK